MIKKTLPKDFLLGASTSSHQVEGGNVWNDWYRFEQSGKVKNSEQSGFACDHYNRYKDDFKLANSFHHNCHRLSIEWSRIEKVKGVFDYKEIEHYRDVLLEIKKAGMKTFVTLHHFTNPGWFVDVGGWENQEAVKHFENYTKIIATHLGDLIDFWITLNEPTLFIVHGYIVGDRPPEIRSVLKAKKAINNYLAAHRKSYLEIHNQCPGAQVGVANNFIKYGIPYIPYIPVLNPVLNLASYMWNFYFLDRISQYQDFIGVNYYTSTRLMQFDLEKRKHADGEDVTISKRLNKGFKIYPEGIYYVLMRVHHKYKKPIYITENGLPDRHDKVRKYYITSHLFYTISAIEKGADVRGYIHWSLIDNFEWDHGFSPRFGLVEIDYKTQERTPRHSSYYYGEICRTKEVNCNYKLKNII